MLLCKTTTHRNVIPEYNDVVEKLKNIAIALDLPAMSALCQTNALNTTSTTSTSQDSLRLENSDEEQGHDSIKCITRPSSGGHQLSQDQ
jgi:hypothetical protein